MNPYQKAAVQEGKAAARRRWKKGVVVKARQRRWQELTEHSAVVELGALHTMAARQARLATLREGRKRRSAVGGGLEADGGWAVEHVPPTGTRGRGGGTELVRGGILVGPEDAGGGAGGRVRRWWPRMSPGCHTGG